MLLAHDISQGYRTKDVKITENVTFETMLLAPQTLQGLKDSGFYKPSPIQLYGIPIGKCGFDLLLEAKSGTGKTAVFSIIALEKIDFCKGLQVIILSPTREIAAQICDVLKQIGSNYPELEVAAVMGGLPVQSDKERFKKTVHIVVSSPGRLRHLIHSGVVDIKSVRLLVLDEADKLMEHSFQADIKYIHAALPKQKQVIMSSATYPECSTDLINSYVQNANHVCPDSDCILIGVHQKVSIVKYNTNIIKYTQCKYRELQKILGQLEFKQCLVFCNYQVRVDEIHKLLRKAQWPSQKLYGQQQQLHRLDALKILQQYKCRILVSTDLAARGIDASNIDLVVNFEPPYDWQTYLHRIGRAGRFGSYGLAVTILSEGKEQNTFQAMFNSMDLPINITHLWTDENFDMMGSAPKTLSKITNLPADNPGPTTTLVEKVPCKDTWEMLCGKSNKIDSIETFESQCKINESSVITEMEKFEELIISLENHNLQDIADDTTFKHVGMKKTEKDTDITGSEEQDTHINGSEKKNTDINGSKEIDTDINGSEEQDTVINGSEEKNTDINGVKEIYTDIYRSEEKGTGINGSKEINTNINESKLKNTFKGSQKKDTDINESDEMSTDINGLKYTNEDNINGTIKENENKLMDSLPDFVTNIETDIDHIATYYDRVGIRHNTRKSLQNSGLPIRFSSSKFKKHDTKANSDIIPANNYNEYNTTNTGINNNKSYRENQVNGFKKAKMFAVDCDIKNNMNSHKRKAKHYISKADSYHKTRNYYEKKHIYNNENHMQQQKIKLVSRIKQTESAKAYYKWYNQLKMNMQHIEQAVYLNEMSKF